MYMVIVVTLFMIMRLESNWFRLVCLPIVAVQVTVLFARYTFSIGKDQVIYQISLFKLPLYQKKADHSTIKRVLFKRVNWKTKSAVIKFDKGIPIRISLLSPDSVFTELMAFCEKHHIEYEKTKEYRMLE